MELESSPDDMALLNAIFRGFHTVKGGAGFLQLHELVECCHIAENVFDILRKGERRVDSELMDVVLQALDAVNEMFSQVRERVEPTPASPELLAALARLAEPASADAAPVVPAAPQVVAEPEAEPAGADSEFEQLLDAIQPAASETAASEAEHGPVTDEITDDEFESLLDQLHGKGQFSAPASAAAPAVPVATDAAAAKTGDEITDEEFEALLDQLHGKGKFEPVGSVAGSSAEAAGAESAKDSAPAASSDEITDDEFEALLDQLHGKGSSSRRSPMRPRPSPLRQPRQRRHPRRSPHVPLRQLPAAAASKAAAPAPAAADKAPAEVETTVRVDTARLDEIMNMVGELVLVRNRPVRLGSNSGDEAMAKAVSNLDVVTADLQSAVMKTRMQPIKKVFGRFPRLVRDLARSLKKRSTWSWWARKPTDKNSVEALADPLVHPVRNAVDHGIEMPEEREAAGKPRTGRVVLSAEQEGDHILLVISDDGKGMDANILRAKAVEKGMLEKDAADRLSDLECYNLIFAPGFSTKTEISDVSGRGVGMDVVKTKISQLNGTVNVFSTKGQGSKVVIKVPLTLAIMPTLMVMLGNRPSPSRWSTSTRSFHGPVAYQRRRRSEVVIVRDKALPLFYLKRWLVHDAAQEEQREGHVVILSVGNQSIGFVVDQLVGQKRWSSPLGKMLQGTPGMSGATITGDGRIALILDVPSMLKRYARRV